MINNKETYIDTYRKSIENPELFWDEIASEFLWQRKYEKVLKWEFETPDVQWFINGKLNITENCIDRHLKNSAEKTAIIFEPNHPDEQGQNITFKQLHDEVCRLANAMKKNGIKKGDRVCIYMPMIPQLAYAVLACARIGAIHSVVFAGFSAQALADRINDSECKMVLCSDGAKRGNKQIDIKQIVDSALTKCPSVVSVLVFRHTSNEINLLNGRDKCWQDEIKGMSEICPAETMDAEDPLFILYTSGSTGKPKGVVHTCGGYMVYTAYTFRNVFQYEKDDVYWCTADIGWITGHSYLVYGPLLNGATTLMFEGVPTFPDAGRFWQVIDKYNVTQFYTAPTAIRALMGEGLSFVQKASLNSLKILGTVGEPINEEAWLWYHKNIGKEKCPIVDTWWQTETGGILISPIPGATDLKPCFATYPLPGVQPVLVDKDGNEITENNIEGLLCIKFPWPSILRTTWGDHERCRTTYFSTFKNLYFTGDAARRDSEGRYRIIGRVDDVINVSGHRIGTAELENAINQEQNIIESAVVGYPHDIKGQGIFAYVISADKNIDEIQLKKSITDTVVMEIGPIAKPDKILVVSGLPKTRSGKIMRRILRKIAEGDTSNLGDTSTLLDPQVVEEIIEKARTL
jgi:acetyl-CoA synthetase